MIKKFLPYLTIGLFSFLSCSWANADTAAKFTPTQQMQIQAIVHDYLLQNPQLLAEMAQKLQQSQVQDAINSRVPELFFSSNSPTIGNAKGNVTLIEFFDYQCPHCKNVAPRVEQLLNSDKNLRVIFKEFPIFGDNSEFAARAALAAQKQNKYLPFHLALMQARAPFNHDQILSIAKSVGLDVKQLQVDMNDPKITAELSTNAQLANMLNLPGTPGFIIADTPANPSAKPFRPTLLPGEVTTQALQQAITSARKG